MHPQYTPEPIPTKQCSRCQERKPATIEYFCFSKRRGVLVAQCRACDIARVKTHYAANKEERKAYIADWQQRNKGKTREYKKKYSDANREHSLLRVRLYRKAHPEKEREYRQANMGRIRAISAVYHALRRAKAKDRSVALSPEDWERALQYFDHACAVCGRHRDSLHSISLDHWIPLSHMDSPGSVKTNIVPLCHGPGGCNNVKGRKHPEQWIAEMYEPPIAIEVLDRISGYFDWMRTQES